MALPAPSDTTTALVTGASSGIGVELARRLAERRHGVTLVARRDDRLKRLCDELSTTHHVRTEAIAADLTDPSARERLVELVAERGLEVTTLVNNAGFSTTGPVKRADRSRELAMVRTDVEAVVDLCTLFVPRMVERRSGAVLNVASTAAFQPLPGQAAYGASKAFVLSYTQALRGELRGSGITVTALCPGPVKTEFETVAGFAEGEAEGGLPNIMWESAQEVARAAIDGLDRGKSVVVPGVANRVTATLAQITPRDLIVPIVARQHPALKRRP
jgi:uncharacterized protein